MEIPSLHACAHLYPLDIDIIDVICNHPDHQNITLLYSNDVMLFLGGKPKHVCTTVWVELPYSEHIYAQLTSMESEMVAPGTCHDTLLQVAGHDPTMCLPG